MKEMEALYAKASPYTLEEMRGKLIRYIAEVSNIAPENINRGCSLRKDLLLDSLDETEFIMWCEKTFELAITDEESIHIRTIGDVLDVIEPKKKWKGLK